MYINWWNFLMQCIALTGWIFLVAVIFTVVEKIIRSFSAGGSKNDNRAAGGKSSG
jgi:flagellar biosynthesis/type III secretory pathway M-ring protein FliF/YscJ